MCGASAAQDQKIPGGRICDNPLAAKNGNKALSTPPLSKLTILTLGSHTAESQTAAFEKLDGAAMFPNGDHSK
jgi:hypothetical protein